MRRVLSPATAVGAALSALTPLLLSLGPEPSLACGGMFCSLSQPVNQAAEQIIFAHDEDARLVTAVVRILYEGPEERFAWLLPVPGVPDVGVSSARAFDALRSATDPTFQLQTEVRGTCRSDWATGPTSAAGGAAFDSPEADSIVSVEAEGTVGPYDYSVISVDENSEDPATAAVEWLTENGFELMGFGPQVLSPYLEDGMNLLAFRLTKGNDSGSIRPIVITYESAAPMIPIRPTAVAAEDDMGILVWVLASGRAIPSNYKHLVLNEALINWFNPSQNYNEVVSAAADEAGGQGFVTELAAPSAGYRDAIFSESDRNIWNEYSGYIDQDKYDVLENMVWTFGQWDGFRDVVAQATDITDMDKNQVVDAILQNPSAVRDRAIVSTQELIDLLYENVIKPVNDTQSLLLSQSYITRLYTTMNATEMTMDPVFKVNPDLADVSNNHVANRIILCNRNVFRENAPVRYELPGGEVFDCHNCQQGAWPFDLGSMPATQSIEELGTTGSGIVVTDNREEISRVLALSDGAKGYSGRILWYLNVLCVSLLVDILF